MPREKRETKPFMMNMSANTYKRLDEYCKKEGKTKTSVVETAVNSFLDIYYDEEMKQKEYRKA